MQNLASEFYLWCTSNFGRDMDLGGITMHRRSFSSFAQVVVAGTLAVGLVAAVDAVTPSTNDANRELGWAHVNEVSQAPGQATFDLVSTRPFASCFEYRTDGDTSQATGPNNYNGDVHDGLYPFVCVNGTTAPLTVTGDAYVEIRMVFGAERDERFDWTSFDIGQWPDPESADDCKQGGWVTYGFSNQGQCVRFVETGKDSR